MVLEAAGGYEFEVACSLQAAGLVVVNPRTARDFARAMGPLAKTDALDARMLAAFARVLHQHPQRERFVKPLADAELKLMQVLVLQEAPARANADCGTSAHTHLTRCSPTEHRPRVRVPPVRTR